MTYLTALEIASNHPNGDIKIMEGQDKETLKWAGFIFLMRNGEIHKLMISMEPSDIWAGFDTQEEATTKMQELIDFAINYVNP